MSDEEFETEESESGEDFSASEDEWRPGKDDGDGIDSEDGSANEVSDQEEDVENSRKSKKAVKIKTAKKPKQANRNHSLTLRTKLFRKYQPPPKSLKRQSSPRSKSPVPTKIANILAKSHYEKAKPLASTSKTSTPQTDDESSSSDDDGLMKPSEIDLSQLETIATKSNENTNSNSLEPAGTRLSDSSDDEQDSVAHKKKAHAKTGSITARINEQSSAEVRDFSDFHAFHNNLESAKAHLKKLCDEEKSTIPSSTKKNKSSSAADETDVTKLLSLGEGGSGTTTDSKSSRKRKKPINPDTDDSDWENVSDDEKATSNRKSENIEITVGSGALNHHRSRDKKAVDLEACLKRRLNREIKERQITMHKVSLLCWISHGNYINRKVNNNALMEMCLKSLPSKNAYPNGNTDTKYFLSFTKWFHQTFELMSKKMYCDLRRLPRRIDSLALQIKTKKIICKKDFVLIFAIMLRAIGIQCRLVMNLPVAPLRPPQKDLLVVSTKPKDEVKPNESKSKMNSSKSEQKKLVKSKLADHDCILPEAKAKRISEGHKSVRDLPEKSKKSSSREQKKKETSKTTNSSSASATKSSSSSSTNEKKGRTDESKSLDSKQAPIGRLAKLKSEKAKTDEPKASTSSTVSSKAKSKSAKNYSNFASLKPTAVVLMESMSDTAIEKATKSEINEPKSSEPLQNTSTKGTTERKVNKPKSETSEAMVFSPKSKNIAASSKSRANRVDELKQKTDFSPLKTRAQRINTRKVPQLDGADDSKKPCRKKSKQKVAIAESDDDFAPQTKKIKAPKSSLTKSPHFTNTSASKKGNIPKRLDHRVLSTDEDNSDDLSADVNRSTIMDAWIEAYNEDEKKWIVIDPVKNKVNALDQIRKSASKPIVYVLAWNNDNTIRDVTARYCSHYHTTTRKLQIDKTWMDAVLYPYVEQKNPRTIIEDVEFSQLQMDTPMPTSVSEYKNHPLYALERHLLKFEAIYPPNPLILGYVRQEAVYARECVHTLHSREIWVKQARVVKIGEKPYKIVKARPKWDRSLNQMQEAQPLEIFGFWQTEPYKPPVAENGMVPRNAYGNVELFKPEMLPIGTRHIQLPSLNRVCKKMNVDCAQAVVGFDFHSGASHPTFDGFVVCEEFADDVIAAWYQDREEAEEKERLKYEARVYGNWKKLIKGLFIRERLKMKYDFGNEKKSKR